MYNDEIKQIVEILESTVEAAYELQRLASEKKFKEMEMLLGDIIETGSALFDFSSQRKENNNVYSLLWKYAGNIRYSATGIHKALLDLSEENREYIAKKTEFELLPICRASHVQIKYMALIEPDETLRDEWIKGEGMELCRNHYHAKAREEGRYKYDLSIIILAYNNLNYTKKCLEMFLAHLPKKATYELILINHGSNDGTREFFESLKPTKQIDALYNGGLGITEGLINEGKYHVFISNDILITKDVLDVMYEAMEEDPEIGICLPMTPNLSNLQMPLNNGINIAYDSFEEMVNITDKYNNRDPRKEEQRVRVCTPLFMMNPAIFDEIYLNYVVHHDDIAFTDDMISLIYRRHGFKNVLLKDVYVHHFPSATIGALKAKRYEEGRKAFFNTFGIDPWGKGICWNYQLFNGVTFDKKDSKRILGINCGLGSDPLKIQQDIKEKTGEPLAEIVNITEKERKVPDLLGVSDRVYCYSGKEELFELINEKYDYIIIEDGFYNDMDLISMLYDRLLPDGFLIVMVYNEDIKTEQFIEREYKGRVQTVYSELTMFDFDDPMASGLPVKANFYVISK